MTQEKVEQILEFGKTLKEEFVVVTKDQSRTFIDFSNEDYDDTHIFNNYLYIWNTNFNHLNLVPLEDIEFIEFY